MVSVLEINNFILDIFIAVFSITWCWILTADEMIFERLYLWLEKKIKVSWIFYPLIGCPKCNAGQVSFWLYLYLLWNDYNAITHILNVTMSIFIAWLLMKIYFKIEANGNEAN